MVQSSVYRLPCSYHNQLDKVKGTHARTGVMTGCKIIDFCRQKSIEIVGIHSVEAGSKVWHESAYIVSMHLLQPVVMSLHPLVTRVIPMRERL